MLAALLPGFRDIRSALVAGYMWFGAVWLLAANVLGPAGGRSLLSEPATQLVNLFGTGGRLVAISVLCLLVGEVTSAIVQSAFFWLSQRTLRGLKPPPDLGWRTGWRRLFAPMSNRALNRVYARVAFECERDGAQDADRRAMEAVHEVLFMSPRLIVAKPELFAEFDRVRSEGEFRDAILLPLPVLGVGICLNLNISWWLRAVLLALVVVLDIYLFLQARRHYRIAGSMVAHSVADGTISSATLDSLQRT